MGRRIDVPRLAAWVLLMGLDLLGLWYGYRAASSYQDWRQLRATDPLDALQHRADAQSQAVVAAGAIVIAAGGMLLVSWRGRAVNGNGSDIG